jgi:hypothetical protein
MTEFDYVADIINISVPLKEAVNAFSKPVPGTGTASLLAYPKI